MIIYHRLEATICILQDTDSKSRAFTLERSRLFLPLRTSVDVFCLAFIVAESTVETANCVSYLVSSPMSPKADQFPSATLGYAAEQLRRKAAGTSVRGKAYLASWLLVEA